MGWVIANHYLVDGYPQLALAALRASLDRFALAGGLLFLLLALTERLLAAALRRRGREARPAWRWTAALALAAATGIVLWRLRISPWTPHVLSPRGIPLFGGVALAGALAIWGAVRYGETLRRGTRSALRWLSGAEPVASALLLLLAVHLASAAPRHRGLAGARGAPAAPAQRPADHHRRPTGGPPGRLRLSAADLAQHRPAGPRERPLRPRRLAVAADQPELRGADVRHLRPHQRPDADHGAAHARPPPDARRAVPGWGLRHAGRGQQRQPRPRLQLRPGVRHLPRALAGGGPAADPGDDPERPRAARRRLAEPAVLRLAPLLRSPRALPAPQAVRRHVREGFSLRPLLAGAALCREPAQRGGIAANVNLGSEDRVAYYVAQYDAEIATSTSRWESC